MIQYEQFGVSEVQVWDRTALPVPADRSVAVEAEDYAAAFDTTAGNAGGLYRNGDVDIEARDGGLSVGWVEAGEWLEFDADLPAGTYDLQARVATIHSGISFSASLDGGAATGIAVPDTGSWAVFNTVTVSNVVVTAGGRHRLRLEFPDSGVNLNWLAFVPVGGDGDADRMRDDWEQQHFGGLYALPGSDADLDGFSNLQEYAALTDPNDSSSFFRIQMSGGSSMVWNVADERTYTVYRTTDLLRPFTVLQSGIVRPATGYTDPDSLSNAYYRVEVTAP